MQNYTNNSKPQIISFDLGGGFWRHVKMNGNVGIDQHGEPWKLIGDHLHGEFYPQIIPLKNCIK
jgi:hypothetical protein